MKSLVQFTTEDGGVFYLEVEDPIIEQPMRGGTHYEGNRGVIQNATTSFEKALQPLKEISSSIIRRIEEIPNTPSEVEVELALKFSAKAGIILTSLDSEANLKVVLKWKKPEQNKINNVAVQD